MTTFKGAIKEIKQNIGSLEGLKESLKFIEVNHKVLSHRYNFMLATLLTSTIFNHGYSLFEVHINFFWLDSPSNDNNNALIKSKRL
jgi:hypothetical protein